MEAANLIQENEFDSYNRSLCGAVRGKITVKLFKDKNGCVKKITLWSCAIRGHLGAVQVKVTVWSCASNGHSVELCK